MTYNTISIFPLPQAEAEHWLHEAERGNGCCLSNGRKKPNDVVYSFAIRAGHGGTCVFLPNDLRHKVDTTLPATLQDSEIELVLDRMALSAPELYIAGTPEFIGRTQKIVSKKKYSGTNFFYN